MLFINCSIDDCKDEKFLQIYKEMKARFRLNVWKDESDGVKKPGYQSKTYRITEIIGNEELMRKKDITIVEEVHITKLGLMGVAL